MYMSVLGQDIDPLLMFASLLKVGKLAGSQVGAQILIGVGTSIQLGVLAV